MTDAERMTQLRARVLTTPHQYHFHQLIELMERTAVTAPAHGRPPVRIVPSDWMSFPASDVKKARSLPDGRIEVQVTFSGFYGVDAPLPHYFLEDITQQREAGLKLQAFLDIFNQQTYWIRHLAWKKFRLTPNVHGTSLFHRLATAITGNYHTQNQQRAAQGNALPARSYSTATLASLLRTALDLPNLRIDNTQLSWQHVDNNLSLNGSSVLGDNTLLGNSILVRGQHIAIDAGHVSAAKAEALAPHSPVGQTLNRLMADFLPSTVDFQLQLQLPTKAAQPLCLAGQNMKLGRPITLGEPPKHTNTHTITYAGEHYRTSGTQPIH